MTDTESQLLTKHEMAMEFSEIALRLPQDDRERLRLFHRAMEIELEVLQDWKRLKLPRPFRWVLELSASALALDAEQYEVARSTAQGALESDVDEVYRLSLEQVMTDANARELRRCEIENELVSAGKIGLGDPAPGMELHAALRAGVQWMLQREVSAYPDGCEEIALLDELEV